MLPKKSSFRQYMTYGDIFRGYWLLRINALKTRSLPRIRQRIAQHCAAMSAIPCWVLVVVSAAPCMQSTYTRLKRAQLSSMHATHIHVNATYCTCLSNSCWWQKWSRDCCAIASSGCSASQMTRGGTSCDSGVYIEMVSSCWLITQPPIVRFCWYVAQWSEND